jgi:hypothetical protein
LHSLKQLRALIFGVLVGAVAVLVANRSEKGRTVVARADQSLQGFLDGVLEGYREQSR